MKLKALLVTTAIAMAAPAIASAAEVETSVYVTASTDYLWRGVSQTANEPGYGAGVDITSGPFYVGAFAGNVDFGTDAHLETDLYASFKPSLGPVDFEFGVLAYMYPHETDLNTFEGKAAASITVPGGVSLTGALFYSPEVGKDGPESLYTEASVGVPLPSLGPVSLAAAAAFGHYDYETGATLADYDNWRVGLTGSLESGWGVEVGYVDTDVTGDDGSAYLTLKRTF